MHMETTITGFVVGDIWMPACECYKPFSYNVTRESSRIDGATLRDHVLQITNDGDFQSCAIALGELTIRTRKRVGAAVVTRVRSWPLDRFPSVADMLHEDPDWCPQGDMED